MFYGLTPRPLQSFARIKKWLDHARSSADLTVIAGGNCDDRKGYFVEPTIIQVKDPRDPLMNEVRNARLCSDNGSLVGWPAVY